MQASNCEIEAVLCEFDNSTPDKFQMLCDVLRQTKQKLTILQNSHDPSKQRCVSLQAATRGFERFTRGFRLSSRGFQGAFKGFEDQNVGVGLWQLFLSREMKTLLATSSSRQRH